MNHTNPAATLYEKSSEITLEVLLLPIGLMPGNYQSCSFCTHQPFFYPLTSSVNYKDIMLKKTHEIYKKNSESDHVPSRFTSNKALVEADYRRKGQQQHT